MFNLRIEAFDRGVDRAFRGLAARMPITIAIALTKTAKAAQQDLTDEMARVFDRPTPYTLRSLAVRPATPEHLAAEVFPKDFGGTPAWKYLGPQVEGGGRRLKRFEVALERAGLLPSGLYAMPGAAAQLDRYGNMSRGQITKILSALRASPDPSQNRGRGIGRGSRRHERYFVGGVGRAAHLKPGIYLGRQGHVRPVIIYGKAPTYSPRFDFRGVAARSIRDNFAQEMQKSLAKTLAKLR